MADGEQRESPDSSDSGYLKPSDVIEIDSLLAFARILNFVEIDASALAQIDAIGAQAQASGTSFQESAENLAIPMTAPIVAFMLHRCLHKWFDSGADVAADAEGHLYLGHFALD